MCANHPNLRPGIKNASSRRLRFWEFTDATHCLVVGTCLSHQDLLKIGRKLHLRYDDDVLDHDVHSYFVSKASLDSPEARAMHKLLDLRHSGMLRIVSRQAESALPELWQQMKDSGQIAGALYAFMTLRIVPQPLRARIFGEVHMLSHLLGASYRQQSAETVRLQAELEETRTRRQRVEAGLHASLEEKTSQIRNMEDEVARLRGALTRASSASGQTGQAQLHSKAQRAIEIARRRAQAAEAENHRLQLQLSTLKRENNRLRLGARKQQMQATSEGTDPDLQGCSILYLGGKSKLVPHLEHHARNTGASFMHHDGGLEDNITRIDAVLPSVDCVVCPVNCISHDACLRAKHGCQKLGKVFLPLKNDSQACFKQALKQLSHERVQKQPPE
jgi:hypothetical protein